MAEYLFCFLAKNSYILVNLFYRGFTASYLNPLYDWETQISGGEKPIKIAINLHTPVAMLKARLSKNTVTHVKVMIVNSAEITCLFL
jgi:hypothetical protein